MPSHRNPDAEATPSGSPDPEENIDVTVMVRAQNPAQPAAQIEAMSTLPVAERHYPSRAEFAAEHGANASDLETVASFARAHGLLVKETSAARRCVVLSGPAPVVAAAFGVTFRQVAGDGGSYRVPVGPITLPPELSPIVETVLGLDDRPHARPHDA